MGGSGRAEEQVLHARVSAGAGREGALGEWLQVGG